MDLHECGNKNYNCVEWLPACSSMAILQTLCKKNEYGCPRSFVWNRYLMLAFISAYNPWNTITNLELRRKFNALRFALIPSSATALSNICQREYSLTIDAIKKQLPTKNKVSIVLDGWTSTNKLAIVSVIGYDIDFNWCLREVQLAFNEVCGHLVLIFCTADKRL